MDDPNPSCESMKSDRCVDLPIAFKDRCSPNLNVSEAAASGPSSESIKSNRSMNLPLVFNDTYSVTDFSVGKKENPTGPSYVSIKSNRSIDLPIAFKDEPSVEPCETEHLKPVPRFPSGQWSRTELDAIFKQLEENIVTFVKDELRRLHTVLWSDYPECFENNREEEEQSIQEAFLNITLDFLRRLKQEPLAELLFSKCSSGVCQTKLKRHLKQRFTCVSEGISIEGKETLLEQIYTELYVIEGGASKVNQEHEVRHIETTSRKRFTTAATITSDDIFKGPDQKLGPIREEPTVEQELFRAEEIRIQSPSRKQVIKKPQPIKNIFKKMTSGLWSVKTEKTKKQKLDRTNEQPIRAEPTDRPINQELTERQVPVRTVLTKGVAGIGKTFLTQKFSLDWAEGRAHQDIQLLFPFTFRELNVLRDRPFSLVGLLHHFFSEIKGLCSLEHLKMLFIFDGLDECRLPLDFSRTRVLTDPTESAIVEELLVNLIRGSLLPSARLWITTRPAAAIQIPLEYISMVTEVRGFADAQKDQYFRKRFIDEEQATAVISHIKKSLSLYIMCYMPIFCWILSTVLEHVLNTREGEDLPQTFTQMYIHFLVVQAKVKSLKYDGRSAADSPWSPETREMVRALAKLAFEQLQKGNLIFYESDLRECGLDAAAASVYSGVFTQVFKEEQGLYEDKVYCFIHLSVQEFLAALYVHQTFFSSGVNLLAMPHSSDSSENESESESESDSEAAFYRSAVDRALESPNGHLDLFLRFLLGLSLPTNQTLLRVLLTQTESSPQVNHKTIEYIKKRIGEGLSTERSINLFHCLNELNDHTLIEQIQLAITEGRLPRMTPALWSALVFILLSSDSELEVFDLRKYSASPTAFQELLPVIKATKKAILSCCFLSKSSCDSLSSVLCSEVSNLTHLDLSNNVLMDSEVELLCSGLTNCKLKTLRLSGCVLEESSCGPLSSVLCSEFSRLRNLDLSINSIKDSGVEQLCSGLTTGDCRLETLILVQCNLSQSCCGPLASVLSSESSSVKHLDLSFNKLRDSGVELLCEGLKTPQCRLETLRLDNCALTQECCGPLSTVLSSTSLTHLDLSSNKLEDSGVELLCFGLENATCKLQTLRLSGCWVSTRGGAALASALSSASSHLTELDLRYNHPGVSAEFLTALQDNPNFPLNSLRMDSSGVKRLASMLRQYMCDLHLDVNTAHRTLYLSEDLRTVRHVEVEQPYPDHQDRFDCRPQVLTSTALEGRCYWEVKWEGCGEEDPGWVDIAVCYKTLKRKGEDKECLFGLNDESWTLSVFKGRYSLRHHGKDLFPFRHSSSQHVAVYLDVESGFLSFFEVLSGHKLCFYSICTTFKEPLVAGLASYCSSVSLV